MKQGRDLKCRREQCQIRSSRACHWMEDEPSDCHTPHQSAQSRRSARSSVVASSVEKRIAFRNEALQVFRISGSSLTTFNADSNDDSNDDDSDDSERDTESDGQDELVNSARRRSVRGTRRKEDVTTSARESAIWVRIGRLDPSSEIEASRAIDLVADTSATITLVW